MKCVLERVAPSVTILNKASFILLCCLTACSGTDSSPGIGPAQSPMPVLSKYVTEYGALNSPFIDTYLKHLIQTIEDVLPQRTATQFSISLLDTGRAIAFTPGGGYILLSRGLVNHLKVEGEIVFVIAHEIAHEVLGHTKSENFYSQNSKQREILEFQADQFAALVLSRAGYDPALSLRALNDAYDDLTEEQYSASYPSKEARSRSLTQFISELPFVSVERENETFKRFKRSLS